MRRGFTLIELLIVIIIIGILTTMAIPQYTKMVDKAKRVEAITMLSSIGTASIMYYIQYGMTTSTVDDDYLDITVPSGSKWQYNNTSNTTAPKWIYTWVAQGKGNGVDTNWKVKMDAEMPDGNKAFYESKNATESYKPIYP